MYELRTVTVKAIDLRTGDRLPIGTRENSIARLEVIDDATVNVWIEGRPADSAPWHVLHADQPMTVRRPTPAEEIMTMQYELTTMTVEAHDLRTGDRIVTSANHARSVKRVEVIDDEIVNVWLEGIDDRPWYQFGAETNVKIQRPTPKPATHDVYTGEPKGRTMYELKTIEIEAGDLRTGDRVVNHAHAGIVSLSVRRVELIDGIVNVWIEGRPEPSRPWYEFTEKQKITVQRPTAPPADDMFDAIESSDAAAAQFERDPQNRGSIEPAQTAQSFADELIALVRKYEQFAPLTRQDIAAALAEPRDELPADDRAQLDNAEPAAVVRMPSRSEITPEPIETRTVGPVAVDRIGPDSEPRYEVSKWSTEDGSFVHEAMFSREEAEALYYALGRELYG